MVGPLKISCLLSKIVRNHIVEAQRRLFIVTKFRVFNKVLDLVNWKVIEEVMKYIPLGTKLGVINFLSQFCSTGKNDENNGSLDQ